MLEFCKLYRFYVFTHKMSSQIIASYYNEFKFFMKLIHLISLHWYKTLSRSKVMMTKISNLVLPHI